jgi:CRP/FNR family transcriptional regulator, cyclic AMP receptor protein
MSGTRHSGVPEHEGDRLERQQRDHAHPDRAGPATPGIDTAQSPDGPAFTAGPTPTTTVRATGDGALRSRAYPESSYILEEDPDLAERLPADLRRDATRLLRAPVVVVDSPRWQPPASEPSANTFGLLVLEGLMGRRIRLGPAVATELLGSGDILRPWDRPTLEHLIPAEADWRVFRPARLAVLDDRITALIGRRPELIVGFASRLFRRARYAHYLMAISHLTRVEDRLRAALWHIASNWGRVTPAGVRVPFRLTHEVLGEIIGAQRPSVTLAIGHLTQRDELAQAPGGEWILTGDPAGWLGSQAVGPGTTTPAA